MIEQIDQLARFIETTSVAGFMRTSRYGYATVNGGHILGITLLAGSIITLDLKLLGLWPTADRMSLVRVLAPVAASGFAIAAISGLLLFSAQATEYVRLPVFQIKMGLVLAGILSAASLHLRYGLWLEMAPLDRRVYLAALSLLIWICALFAGRFIAFSATQ